VTCEAIQGRVGSKFRRAATVGRGGSARQLNLSAGSPTVDACGLGPYSFRVRQDARGLRADALTVVLGGLCAEGRSGA
jgi:hypothetical protein